MKTKNEKQKIQILNIIIKGLNFKTTGELLIILLLDQVTTLVVYINRKVKSVKNIKDKPLYQVQIGLQNRLCFDGYRLKVKANLERFQTLLNFEFCKGCGLK